MATEAPPPLEMAQDAPPEPSADAQKPPVKRSWR
jgi:hypothetical protein